MLLLVCVHNNGTDQVWAICIYTCSLTLTVAYLCVLPASILKYTAFCQSLRLSLRASFIDIDSCPTICVSSFLMLGGSNQSNFIHGKHMPSNYLGKYGFQMKAVDIFFILFMKHFIALCPLMICL